MTGISDRLWLFLISDSFIFGGLMISRINLLGLTRPELIQGLGFAVTTVLLASSFFANRAEASMEFGDHRQFIVCLSLTLGLGLLFLVGVVGVEWQLAPFGPQTNLAGAVFYVMTGFHAFHVLTGVIFLSVVLRNGLRGLNRMLRRVYPQLSIYLIVQLRELRGYLSQRGFEPLHR